MGEQAEQSLHEYYVSQVQDIIMPKVVKQNQNGSTKKDVGTGVLSRIAPIGFDDDEGLKVLLYGKSGTGKTTLAATFSDDGPMLWVIFSGGKRPGELRSINTAEYRKRINQIAIQDMDELPIVLDHLHSSDKYKGVCLDHVSGLQDKVLATILGLESGEMPEQKSWGIASQQQYGQCTAQCKEHLKALLSFRGHVIILGQERTFNADEERSDSEILQPFVSVALTPALAGWLPPSCDYVCQTYLRNKTEPRTSKIGQKEIITQVKTSEVEYMLRTYPHESYASKFRITKDRRKNLPQAISDPSYAKIKKLISG